MEHKGIHYSVVQTIGGAFKWTASLATRVGEARNRQMAILQAIEAIDKDQRQIKAALRKSRARTQVRPRLYAWHHLPWRGWPATPLPVIQ
jgi:hypothetical protein